MTKNKRNDDSQFFRDWTTAKLKAHYYDLHHAIYVVQCFRVKDLDVLDGVASELFNRGARLKKGVAPTHS